MPILGMFKEVLAVFWGKGVQDGGRSGLEAIESSLCGMTQPGFEFRESHLNWIEIGTIGRQITERCPTTLNSFPDALDLMNAEVVADHHVSWLKFRAEDLLDIGQEGFSGHWAIQEKRGTQTVLPQGGD
jgi:hypothetical protein